MKTVHFPPAPVMAAWPKNGAVVFDKPAEAVSTEAVVSPPAGIVSPLRVYGRMVRDAKLCSDLVRALPDDWSATHGKLQVTLAAALRLVEGAKLLLDHLESGGANAGSEDAS